MCVMRSCRVLLEAPPRVLITGGLGQIGTDLAIRLRERLGVDNVLVSDVVDLPARHPLSEHIAKFGGGKDCDHKPVIKLNCLDKEKISQVMDAFRPTWFYHLPAIMSVRGEKEPELALDVNLNTMRVAFDLSTKRGVRLFIPSTIAVFGADCGKVKTQDDTILNPVTIYGVTKIVAEQLGRYYKNQMGLDFRSLRLPGIISAATLPGGGTTDYAVHMYHYALRKETYICPLRPDESLPMMHMDDTLDALFDVMSADASRLTRCVYNVSGCSFNPEQLRSSITKRMGYPMAVDYKEGVEQKIAETWPDAMDDSKARHDWNFNPKVDLEAMTDKMLRDVSVMHGLPPPPP